MGEEGLEFSGEQVLSAIDQALQLEQITQSFIKGLGGCRKLRVSQEEDPVPVQALYRVDLRAYHWEGAEGPMVSNGSYVVGMAPDGTLAAYPDHQRLVDGILTVTIDQLSTLEDLPEFDPPLGARRRRKVG